MALIKDFKSTILARAQNDKRFRQALLVESVNELLANNIDIAKSLLRDYINATISFQSLADILHKNSKSIQRMLSAHGNPTTKSLIEMLHVLQANEGIQLHVHCGKR